MASDSVSQTILLKEHFLVNFLSVLDTAFVKCNKLKSKCHQKNKNLKMIVAQTTNIRIQRKKLHADKIASCHCPILIFKMLSLI